MEGNAERATPWSLAEGPAPPLAPSKLGTKEHWDAVYEREVKTYEEIGDEGEVWFGEDSADDMVEWIEENYAEEKDIKIIDVGCGNGDLVFRLLSAGYTNTIGVDYSQSSVDLARAIAKRKDIGTDHKTFEVKDILKESSETVEETQPFDVVCDKGTYDAISLSDELLDGKPLIERYPTSVTRMLKSGGVFLITSCNWTKKELESAFITPENGFEYLDHIPRPSFTFGGATGQSITTVAFRKS